MIKRIVMGALFVLLAAGLTAQENAEERLDLMERQIAELQNDLAEIRSLLEGSSGVTANGTAGSSDRQADDEISVQLQNMSFHESNSSNDYANDYSDWLSFHFIFTNETGRTLSDVKGQVVFMDVFGEEWWWIGLTLNESMLPGQAIPWEGMIDYNGFIDAHKTARRSDSDSIRLYYDVEKILYAD